MNFAGFFESIQSELNGGLAGEIELMLGAVAGQRVCCVGVSSADTESWRPDLCTEESLAAAVQDQSEAYEKYGWGDPEPQLRWFPDEWTALEHGPDAPWLEGTAEVGTAIFDHLEAHAEQIQQQWDEWLAAFHDAMWTALTSPEVRAVFSAAGCEPFVVVCENDGDNSFVKEGFIAANRANPNRELFEQGVAYWSKS